jgi:hypothetical protein
MREMLTQRDIGGTVTVSQIGGYDREEGCKVRVEGAPLLKPSKKYMFVTSYNQEEGWYATVAQPFGDISIENETRRKEVEERFEKAKEVQILFGSAAPVRPPERWRFG